MHPNLRQVCGMTQRTYMSQTKNLRCQLLGEQWFTREALWREKKDRKKEEQKGQDLWSHLASNSFTFCSPQRNIRGPKGTGTGARGRMSRPALNLPAKPARLCGTLRPSFDNKREGLTLARQPPVPGWTSSLLKVYRSGSRLQHSGQLFTRRPDQGSLMGAFH